MKNYLLTFSYDGLLFYGYQKQPNKRTVQECIEKILTSVINENIELIASGRTDKGVHANNQSANFLCSKELDCKRIKYVLNRLLDNDIHIKDVEEVPSKFHARFSSIKKEYIYKMNVGTFDVHKRNYVYQYNKEIDIDKFRKILKMYEGKHDFSSFTSSDCIKNDYVREILSINIVENNGIIEVQFIGNGFIKYQIRNMLGLAIYILENNLNEDYVLYVMELKKRPHFYKAINPEGLYLEKVYY